MGHPQSKDLFDLFFLNRARGKTPSLREGSKPEGPRRRQRGLVHASPIRGTRTRTTGQTETMVRITELSYLITTHGFPTIRFPKPRSTFGQWVHPIRESEISLLVSMTWPWGFQGSAEAHLNGDQTDSHLCIVWGAGVERHVSNSLASGFQAARQPI